MSRYPLKPPDVNMGVSHSILCPYCQMNSGGQHKLGCPNSPVKTLSYGTSLPYDIKFPVAPATITFHYMEYDPPMITDAHNQQEIDSLNGIINALRGTDGKASTREKALAVTKLEEAIMWLEKDAKLNQ